MWKNLSGNYARQPINENWQNSIFWLIFGVHQAGGSRKRPILAMCQLSSGNWTTGTHAYKPRSFLKFTVGSAWNICNTIIVQSGACVNRGLRKGEQRSDAYDECIGASDKMFTTKFLLTGWNGKVDQGFWPACCPFLDFYCNNARFSAFFS